MTLPTPTSARDQPTAPIGRDVRRALGGYLQGRKLVKFQIRRAEGGKVEGFLKIEGGSGERTLVDFKAVAAIDGGLSSLEVGGKRILLDAGVGVKRLRERTQAADAHGSLH